MAMVMHRPPAPDLKCSDSSSSMSLHSDLLISDPIAISKLQSSKSMEAGAMVFPYDLLTSSQTLDLHFPFHLHPMFRRCQSSSSSSHCSVVSVDLFSNSDDSTTTIITTSSSSVSSSPAPRPSFHGESAASPAAPAAPEKQKSSYSPPRCIATRCLHRSAVCAAAISDKFFFSASQSDEIFSWELPDLLPSSLLPSSGRLPASVKRSGSVKAMATSGDRLFTAHQDGKIRVWRSSDFKLLSTMPRRRDRLIKSLSQKNYVQIGWRHAKKKLWIQHADAVSCLAMAAGSQILYSGSWDRTVKVWSMADLRCLESFRAHDDAVNAIATSSFYGVLYTGSADGTVKVWRRKEKEREQSRWGYIWRWRKTKQNLQISASSRHVCVAKLQLAMASTSTAERYSVNALAVSSNGELLFSAGSDGIIRVWGRGAGQSFAGELRASVPDAHRRMPVLCLSVATLRPAAEDDVLISGGADKTARIWRLRRRTAPAATSSHCCILDSGGDEYRSRNIAAGWLPESLPDEEGLQFLGDELNRNDCRSRNATGNDGEQEEDSLPESLQCIGELHGHGGAVKSIAADRVRRCRNGAGVDDGDCIIYTGSSDKCIKVWSFCPRT